MIHELTRDDLEFLLGDIEYMISDGYVVDGFPKEEIDVYSEEYWKAVKSMTAYFQKRVDKRYGKCQ